MVVIPYKFNGKEELRKWLYKYLSDYHLKMIPRPCFGRIPSFQAPHVATVRLGDEAAWKTADAVLISPDEVTYEARKEALRAGKTLFVPIPKTGDCWLLDGIAAKDALVAAMTKEIGRFAKTVPLSAAHGVPLIVTGALSVDRFGGWLGQGEVFGEIHPDLMRMDGPFSAATRIAVVDDMQIFEDFGYLLAKTDAQMDRIVTKTQSFSPQAREASPAGQVDGPLRTV